MKTKDVIKVYGTKTAIAEELGLSVAAVSSWGEIVPEKNAPRLAAANPSKLIYDMDFYTEQRINKKTAE